MGRRYYCDYCDRSFKDDPEARKKHLSSLQHAKNRAHHYSSFKDPEAVLNEELGKIPCKRYATVGDCAFGHGCKFSHYSPLTIRHLEYLVSAKKAATSSAEPRNGWPDPEKIVGEYFNDIMDPDNTEEHSYPSWNAPIELHDYPNLPPSLWPLTPDTVTDSNFASWS